VDAIIQKSRGVETDELSDPSLVTPFRPRADFSPSEGAPPDTFYEEDNDEWADYPDGIRVEQIKGDTYKGYVMIIRDPSRVYTAASSDFQSGKPGLLIMEAYKREGAVAAINGGGFYDPGGTGSGDTPLGVVISKGQALWGDEGVVYESVVGFDRNDTLIVGSMTLQKARDMGIRDALSFGPTLVKNGEPAQIRREVGGLNPRSAIGQRADGAVILLCIEGRMSSSLGASVANLVGIMMELGAVNAANLDGGFSSGIVYEGEHLNTYPSLYGARRMPTFFMVSP
jgi:exopolysaccharide biosynthesis protein